MPKRALAEHRPWLLAGIAMAIAFWLLGDAKIGGIFIIALKGASVAALAGYALARSRGPSGQMIAVVMSIGAAGDIGMELYVTIGAAFFLVGHLVAIWLYRRNVRADPTGSQLGAAAALVLGVPIIGWLLTGDFLVAIYGLALGSMAGSAWLSRFSRYHVGFGAVLFVASDLLIFARMGGVLDQSVTEWFVWPLYYTGQFLICTGVIRTVRRDHAA